MSSFPSELNSFKKQLSWRSPWFCLHHNWRRPYCLIAVVCNVEYWLVYVTFQLILLNLYLCTTLNNLWFKKKEQNWKIKFWKRNCKVVSYNASISIIKWILYVIKNFWVILFQNFFNIWNMILWNIVCSFRIKEKSSIYCL